MSEELLIEQYDEEQIDYLTKLAAEFIAKMDYNAYRYPMCTLLEKLYKEQHENS